MKKIVATGAFALVVVAGAVYFFGRSAAETTPKASPSPLASAKSLSPSPNRVTGQVLGTVQAGGATLIDVRTPEEFAAGHAQQAVNFDVAKLQAGELPDVAKSAKIYLYCRTGIRAGAALTILRQAGFTDVTSLGGLSDWINAGGAQES